MVGDVVQAVKFFYEALKTAREARRGTAAHLFSEVVESSFRQLGVVHDDYIRNLSVLKRHLKTRELPPKDLLHWLLDAGLKYRKDREYLRTIEEELKGFDYSGVLSKNTKPELGQALRDYIKAVIDYWRSTTGHNELSFYRDYEQSLSSLIDMLESGAGQMSSQQLAKHFYGSEWVTDVLQALTDALDRSLPRSWKQVGRCYRLVRALLEYPPSHE